MRKESCLPHTGTASTLRRMVAVLVYSTIRMIKRDGKLNLFFESVISGKSEKITERHTMKNINQSIFLKNDRLVYQAGHQHTHLKQKPHSSGLYLLAAPDGKFYKSM